MFCMLFATSISKIYFTHRFYIHFVNKVQWIKVSGVWREISKQHVSTCFNEDVRQRGSSGLRVMRHLKASHFNPCSFEKMRVSYATAMFGKDVMDYLNNKNQDGWIGTIEFFQVVRQFREFFVNTIVAAEPDPRKHISSIAEVERTVEALATKFETWQVETYSSPRTDGVHAMDRDLLQDAAQALRTTLDIVKMLISDIPGCHIRISWLCQDALENIFGQERGGVGGSNNPTVQQFHWQRSKLVLRQHRFRSTEYKENYLLTHKPHIKKKKNCSYLPFIGHLLHTQSVIHAQKSDLLQVLPAFGKRTKISKAIRTLLTQNDLLQTIGTDIQARIDANDIVGRPDPDRLVISSFFESVGMYIKQLAANNLNRLPEVSCLSLPEIHFLATLLCNSVIRFVPKGEQAQSQRRSIYMDLDTLSLEVFYHVCCAHWSLIRNQMVQISKRCSGKIVIAFYKSAIAVVDSIFVTREYAIEYLQEAKLTLNKERYQGYIFVHRDAVAICKSI